VYIMQFQRDAGLAAEGFAFREVQIGFEIDL
jgi:hypothetical protein